MQLKPNSGANPFSLAEFEYLCHGHFFEQALQELLKLLGLLERAYGALQGIGEASSRDNASHRMDLTVTTRLASAIGALFSNSGLRISSAGYMELMRYHRWFQVIFGASALNTSDHVAQLLISRSVRGGIDIIDDESELLKLLIMYSLDSKIPLALDKLWTGHARLAIPFMLALLSSRFVISDAASEKKEKLLKWLPSRLENCDLADLPLAMLHDVYMHCTYADGPGKHDVKRAINQTVRRQILKAQFKDIDGVPGPASARPVLLCIVEQFYSDHSIYRTHSLSIQALRERYWVVGISLNGMSDDTSREVFDELHLLPFGQSAEAVLRTATGLARMLQPEIAYFPSVGMMLETIFLTNIRLAPIQIAGLGHPATTHSALVDYVVVEEDHVGDAACFSERLLVVPRNAMPYRPPAGGSRPEIPVKQAGEPLRIAVVASVMKINPNFLRVLQCIVERWAESVEIHVLPGTAAGIAKTYLQNLVTQFIPHGAVVYPEQDYFKYLATIGMCDLFLNPFPFGNTNGIVDTVRMGLPGVCMTGPEVHSHIDEGLFARLAMPSWLVARSEEEYINAALRLMRNSAERSALRDRLLKTNPEEILFRGDAGQFVRAFDWLRENYRSNPAAREKIVRPLAGSLHDG